MFDVSQKTCGITIIGTRTAGYTTVNRYFKLSDDYGIEIPVGYMGTRDHVFDNGIDADRRG
jgi:hypothetical protein